MLNIIMNFETVEGTIALLALVLIVALFLGLPMFLILKVFEQEEKIYKKYLEEKLKNSESISTEVPINNMFSHIALMNTTIFTTL